MAVELEAFLANMTTTVTAVSGWFVSIGEIFTHPPYIIFLGLGIVVSLVYLVKSILHR